MLLKLSNVNQFYGQTHILWDIDLCLAKGKCTCLMGRNGVGKTTLVQSIMGNLKIKKGNIQFNDTDITHKSIETRAYMGIGYVPQGRQIFSQLTVEENLRVGLAAKRSRSAKIPDLVYSLFPVLKEMKNRCGGDLSGGQQQQLAIGRALVIEPSLLILDEPTEGIQPNIVHDIGDIINRLNHELGLTVLLVEQKLPFIQMVADDFYLLDRGRNIANGALQQLTPDLIKNYLTV